MDLFHVSKERYPVGHAIKPLVAKHVSNATERGQQWVNNTLDGDCPAGFPKRSSSVFAFATVGQCWTYAQGESHSADWRFYRVELSLPHACSPMALVDTVRRLGQAHPLTQVVVTEYWKPTLSWKFLEYFGPKAIVLEDVTDSVERQQEPFIGLAEGLTARMDYQSDHDDAHLRWSK